MRSSKSIEVLYGSTCILLTQTVPNKLHVFQTKSLGRTLKIPPTFIDRSYLKQRVLDFVRDTHHISIDLFSQMWLKRKLKLVGDTAQTIRSQVLLEYNIFHGTQCHHSTRHFAWMIASLTGFVSECRHWMSSPNVIVHWMKMRPWKVRCNLLNLDFLQFHLVHMIEYPRYVRAFSCQLVVCQPPTAFPFSWPVSWFWYWLGFGHIQPTESLVVCAEMRRSILTFHARQSY